MARNITKKSKTSRKLTFRNKSSDAEEEDEEVSESLLDKELNQLVKEVTKKWNFDFSSETPLEGEWEWESANKSENEKPLLQSGNKTDDEEEEAKIVKDTKKCTISSVKSVNN